MAGCDYWNRWTHGWRLLVSEAQACAQLSTSDLTGKGARKREHCHEYLFEPIHLAPALRGVSPRSLPLTPPTKGDVLSEDDDAEPLIPPDGSRPLCPSPDGSPAASMPPRHPAAATSLPPKAPATPRDPHFGHLFATLRVPPLLPLTAAGIASRPRLRRLCTRLRRRYAALCPHWFAGPTHVATPGFRSAPPLPALVRLAVCRLVQPADKFGRAVRRFAEAVLGPSLMEVRRAFSLH